MESISIKRITNDVLNRIEALLPDDDSRLYNDAGKALIWRLREEIEKIRTQNRREYYIWISGSDFMSTSRFLTADEADVIKELLDELNDNYEGCSMELMPTEDEIREMCLEVYPEKPEVIADINKFTGFIMKKHPDKSILWAEHVAGRCYDYTNKDLYHLFDK